MSIDFHHKIEHKRIYQKCYLSLGALEFLKSEENDVRKYLPKFSKISFLIFRK